MLRKENNSLEEEVQSTIAVVHPRDLAEEKRKKSLLSKISSYNDKKKLIKDSLQILDKPQNKKVKFSDGGSFSEVQCETKPSVDSSAEINKIDEQYNRRNKQENHKSTVSSPLCKDLDGELLDAKAAPLSLSGKANRDKLQRQKKKKMSAEYSQLDDKQEEATEVQLLFGSSDDDDDNADDDKRFSVNKDRKLIELQSRFATDKRFVLDERFQEETSEETIDEIKKEKEMEKEIVYSILGQRPPRKLNAPKPVMSFVRYNPSNEAHRSFEKPLDQEADNSDKKKVNNSKKPVIPANEVPEEVLKNKFYTVSSNLKNRLQNAQESSFSVFSLFDRSEDPAEKVQEEKFEEEEVEARKNFRELPGLFENELSIVDDAGESKNVGDSENIKRSAGIIKETFFFTKNDPRFLEGLEFSEGKDFSFDFKTKRRRLKQVVRSKIKTNQDKSQQLKRRNRFRTINVQKRKKHV